MKKIEDIRILVVGDIMLDKYVMGEVERISPEAPVPIVKVLEEYHTLGGCGNVVRNIREIGPKVDCLASIGSDRNGRTIIDELDKINVTSKLITDSKVTIVKERVIADERKIQMIRVDRECIKSVDHEMAITALKEVADGYSLEGHPLKYDVIVVSDYGKGMITNKLMKYLNKLDTRIIVDPKPQNKKIYGFPFMITPNEKEIEEMGGANELVFNGCKYVLETKGQRGMSVYDEIQSWDIEAEPVEVYNVSGAGDTVIAVMAICISMGYSAVESATVANRCAGYVVTQPGTSVVPKDIFMDTLDVYYT